MGLTTTSIRDTEGPIVGTFGVSRDITAWKSAEQALRLGEERFRSLIEATAAIVWTTPASGEFETEQPGWSAFTGQRFEQLKGWGWLDAVHPDDRPKTARVWSEAVAAGTLYQVEHRLRRHDGEYLHMLARAVPILDKGSGIREWIGVHTDIDAERHAEPPCARRRNGRGSCSNRPARASMASTREVAAPSSTGRPRRCSATRATTCSAKTSTR